ncbi:MAG TPA: glycosyltransferase family 4 protein [Candidatus Saccharimonadales bacterium]|nr:glycosyltransferase family 4 protein [Candidatus Saccharimonadales bacterium]
MEKFAYELSTSLQAHDTVKIIKWGGANKYLPLILPLFFIKACFLLLKGDIDILHMQDGVIAPLGYLLSRMFRKPFIVIIHGLDITYSNYFYQRIIPYCLSKANKIVCISGGAASEVIKKNIPESHIVTIPLGIYDHKILSESAIKKWRKSHGITKDCVTLLTVGRLVKRKGVAWFIENVMPNLIRTYPNLRYIIIGTGPEKLNIINIVNELKLNEHVHLLGKISDDELAKAYASSTIFVQPNIHVPNDMEGFGLVLLEAAVNSLPVVAANIEGISDAVHQQRNGILVPAGDSEAFLIELKNLISNPGQTKKFSKLARKYTLQNFNWHAISNQYHDLYSQLLNSARSQH